MPFPSNGCQPCRTRRIKCDNAQPICQRCIRALRRCDGSRQAFSILHSENSFASGRKKRPRGPRSHLREEPRAKSATISRSLSHDLQASAISYYINHQLCTFDQAPPILRTLSDDLPALWTSRKDCQLLDLAISAIALAVFSHCHNYRPAAVLASLRYQDLLQQIRITIPSLHQNNIESCLLSTLFMGLYEDCIYCPQESNGTPMLTALKYPPHHGGALAILKFWKANRLPATLVIKNARRAVMKHSLLRSAPFPEWLKDGCSFGEVGLELAYERIEIGLITTREALFSLLRDEAESRKSRQEIFSRAESLIRETREVDRALQLWRARFPNEWSYSRCHMTDDQVYPNEHFFSQTVYHHRSQSCAAIWTRYYASRMLIMNTCLKTLQLFDGLIKNHDKDLRECSSQIQASAHDLACTLPFCLGKFKVAGGTGSFGSVILLNTKEETKPYFANLVISPLAVASRIGCVDTCYKLWFKRQIASFGKILGYGIFDAAMTDNWIEF